MLNHFRPKASKARVITGARYEDGDMLMHTGSRSVSGDTLVALKTADWLPMASCTYSIDDRTNVRLVASRTLGRPEYREIAPFEFQDYAFGAATKGNPHLKTTYIGNYDLRLEFFPRTGEVLAVSGFAKSFTNPIEIFVESSSSHSAIEYLNAESAKNLGVEFEARKLLDMLPGKLSRLTLGGNRVRQGQDCCAKPYAVV